MFNRSINPKKLLYLFASVTDMILQKHGTHVGEWTYDADQENKLWLLERINKKFDVINLEKTILSMRKAFFFLYKLFTDNRFTKLLLLNGIKLDSGTSAGKIMSIINLLNGSRFPYILYWLPGLLTNKKSRIYLYKSYKSKRFKKRSFPFLKNHIFKSVVNSIEFINKNIFKASNISSTIKKRSRKFRDRSVRKRLKNLSFLPTLLFSFGAAEKNRTAIKEFHKFGIPIIALVDTDSSVELIQFPIYSSDNTIPNFVYFLNLVISTVERARHDRIIFEARSLGIPLTDELLRNDRLVTEHGVTVEDNMGVEYYENRKNKYSYF